jgi:hypothetical protein
VTEANKVWKLKCDYSLNNANALYYLKIANSLKASLMKAKPAEYPDISTEMIPFEMRSNFNADRVEAFEIWPIYFSLLNCAEKEVKVKK